MNNFNYVSFFGNNVFEHNNKKGFNGSISLGKGNGYIDVTYFGKERPVSDKPHNISGKLVTEKNEKTNEYSSRIIITMFKVIEKRIFDSVDNDEIVEKLGMDENE